MSFEQVGRFLQEDPVIGILLLLGNLVLGFSIAFIVTLITVLIDHRIRRPKKKRGEL